ncbi:hypothetical protein AS850_04730 [Frondihabitans sp. 762G35]|uniref:hypothetical protein n=1 Tax=Frondihabitans sp. 762G35 TaxID=1446794 RepID=UPI000D220F69|nr:hypothetical protein [Frondihabitans sp. 762G35]ARC56380.1 hypothetical protein AS850_04730 [Frondihabitans sp. 762G35]
MKITPRVAALTAVALTSGAFVVGIDSAVAPAAEAACYTNLTETRAYNASCRPKARHWVVSRSSGTHYGAFVAPGGWSTQKVCYTNVASRGVSVQGA